MIINTEQIKDQITDYFNTETQKAIDSNLSENLSQMAQTNFQESKIMALKEIEKFEDFIRKLSSLTNIFLSSNPDS